MTPTNKIGELLEAERARRDADAQLDLAARAGAPFACVVRFCRMAAPVAAPAWFRHAWTPLVAAAVAGFAVLRYDVDADGVVQLARLAEHLSRMVL